MKRAIRLFDYQKDFKLEVGSSLPGFQLKYTTLGTLNADKSNVVWLCHALTGSSEFDIWWKDFFENDTPFDPKDYFIICANTLGGCYGSTGPLSINPTSGQPYYHDFPVLTNRDAVRAFDLLREHLEIEKVHTLIGSSMGGQQALEWAIEKPSHFERLIVIAANAVQSSWGVGINEAQRMAIQTDTTWKEDQPLAGYEGMKAARAIGMISFRSYDCFNATQPLHSNDALTGYHAASYQQYQGKKLADRFTAFTYWVLLNMMDNHNVGRGRGGLIPALQKITAKTLLIGIPSDLLFPINEQEFIADNINQAVLAKISSTYGHDGFLIELDQVKESIHTFLQSTIAQEPKEKVRIR